MKNILILALVAALAACEAPVDSAPEVPGGRPTEGPRPNQN